MVFTGFLTRSTLGHATETGLAKLPLVTSGLGADMTIGVCGFSHSFRTPGVLVARANRGVPRGKRGARCRTGIARDRDGRVASQQPAAGRMDGARLGARDCGARASVTRDVDRLGARPQVGRSAVARAVASLRALARR